MANLTIELGTINIGIDRLSNLAPLYKAWANHIEGLAIKAFKNQAAIDGSSWQPLTDRYRIFKEGYATKQQAKRRAATRSGQDFRDRRGKPKAGGSKKLQWTGSLYDSIYSRVSEDGVVVGSNLKVGRYSLAAIHMFGAPKRRIPARPFLPMDESGEPLPQLREELRQMAIDYLAQ